jgi:hypothetical protein
MRVFVLDFLYYVYYNINMESTTQLSKDFREIVLRVREYKQGVHLRDILRQRLKSFGATDRLIDQIDRVEAKLEGLQTAISDLRCSTAPVYVADHNI